MEVTFLSTFDCSCAEAALDGSDAELDLLGHTQARQAGGLTDPCRSLKPPWPPLAELMMYSVLHRGAAETQSWDMGASGMQVCCTGIYRRLIQVKKKSRELQDLHLSGYMLRKKPEMCNHQPVILHLESPQRRRSCIRPKKHLAWTFCL